MLHVVLMGVAGSGKSTIGTLLAERLGWAFMDGDALHPSVNVAKMRAGVPLTDVDRAPWLAAVAHWIGTRGSAGEPGLVACSALKRSYRDDLRRECGADLRFIFLDADEETLRKRLALRQDHFMTVALLDSQRVALDPPAADEAVLRVDATLPPDAIVDAIVAWIGIRGEPGC